jgi:adenosylhomocysteine nucleosidase
MLQHKLFSMCQKESMMIAKGPAQIAFAAIGILLSMDSLGSGPLEQPDRMQAASSRVVPIHTKGTAILVITAVDNEYDAVRSVLTRPRDGIVGGRQVTRGSVNRAYVVVIRSGWGKAHAAGATALGIERFHPKIVLMAGVGGGLDISSVRSGDVVIAEATFQHDLGKMTETGFEPWSPETPLETARPKAEFPGAFVAVTRRAAAQTVFVPWKLPTGCECGRDGNVKPVCTALPTQVDRPVPRVCSGVIATGDTFVADPNFAHRMAVERRAVSVDMESAAVAQEASNEGLPFVGVRIIADVVESPGGESLYYCLKPYTGRRLASVMENVLPALIAVLDQKAPDDSNGSLVNEECQAKASQ